MAMKANQRHHQAVEPHSVGDSCQRFTDDEVRHVLIVYLMRRELLEYLLSATGVLVKVK
jgi:hypothetical protein